MKRILIILGFISLLGLGEPLLNCWSYPLKLPLLGEKDEQTLLKEGMIFNISEKGDDLFYLPESLFSDQINEARYEQNPHVSSEILILVKNPKIPDLELEMYNLIQSAGRYTEATFFYERAQEPRSVFRTSTRINNKDERIPLADPVLETIPARNSFLVEQKVATLNSIVLSEVDILYDQHIIYFKMQNITNVMRKLVIVALPGRMTVQMLVASSEEEILVYCLSTLKIFPPALIASKQILTLFSSRITILAEWYAAEIGKLGS